MAKKKKVDIRKEFEKMAFGGNVSSKNVADIADIAGLATAMLSGSLASANKVKDPYRNRLESEYRAYKDKPNRMSDTEGALAYNDIRKAKAMENAENWFTGLLDGASAYLLNEGMNGRTPFMNNQNNEIDLRNYGLKTSDGFIPPKFAIGGQVQNPLMGMPGMEGVPVEVEGNEVAQLPNEQMVEFQGPSHEEGGIEASLPMGTTIYSDRVKIDNKTMAQRKTAREKKINALRKKLEKNPTDFLLKNAIKRLEEVNELEDAHDEGLQQEAGQVMEQEQMLADMFEQAMQGEEQIPEEEMDDETGEFPNEFYDEQMMDEGIPQEMAMRGERREEPQGYLESDEDLFEKEEMEEEQEFAYGGVVEDDDKKKKKRKKNNSVSPYPEFYRGDDRKVNWQGIKDKANEKEGNIEEKQRRNEKAIVDFFKKWDDAGSQAFDPMFEGIEPITFDDIKRYGKEIIDDYSKAFKGVAGAVKQSMRRNFNRDLEMAERRANEKFTRVPKKIKVKQLPEVVVTADAPVKNLPEIEIQGVRYRPTQNYKPAPESYSEPIEVLGVEQNPFWEINDQGIPVPSSDYQAMYIRDYSEPTNNLTIQKFASGGTVDDPLDPKKKGEQIINKIIKARQSNNTTALIEAQLELIDAGEDVFKYYLQEVEPKKYGATMIPAPVLSSEYNKFKLNTYDNILNKKNGVIYGYPENWTLEDKGKVNAQNQALITNIQKDLTQIQKNNPNLAKRVESLHHSAHQNQQSLNRLQKDIALRIKEKDEALKGNQSTSNKSSGTKITPKPKPLKITEPLGTVDPSLILPDYGQQALIDHKNDWASRVGNNYFPVNTLAKKYPLRLDISTDTPSSSKSGESFVSIDELPISTTDFTQTNPNNIGDANQNNEQRYYPPLDEQRVKQNKGIGIEPTFGDLLSMYGNYRQAKDAHQIALQNRATDLPNINAFENYGKEGLKTMQGAKDFATQVRDQQTQNLALEQAGMMRQNRNTARGINTQRALDLTTLGQVNQAKNKMYEQYANQMTQLLGQEANFQNQKDQAYMAGEDQRRDRDTQDRDAFYSAIQATTPQFGKMISQTGKDINAIHGRKVNENFTNMLSNYLKINAKNGTTQLKEGVPLTGDSQRLIDSYKNKEALEPLGITLEEFNKWPQYQQYGFIMGALSNKKK